MTASTSENPNPNATIPPTSALLIALTVSTPRPLHPAQGLAQEPAYNGQVLEVEGTPLYELPGSGLEHPRESATPGTGTGGGKGGKGAREDGEGDEVRDGERGGGERKDLYGGADGKKRRIEKKEVGVEVGVEVEEEDREDSFKVRRDDKMKLMSARHQQRVSW